MNRVLAIILLGFVTILHARGGAERLKVGVVLPITGRFADYGNECLAGMNLAVQETKVCSLMVEDNEGDKVKTVASIKRLASQGANIIVGPIIPENALAAAYIADSLNIILILPATTYPLVTELSNLVFRLCYTDEFQAKVMAEFVHFGLGKNRVAMFIDNNAVYSIEIADLFRKEMEKLGGRIVATKTYISEETDFSDALTKIREANPDCIFMPSYSQQAGTAIKQARDLGIDVPIIGTDGWDTKTLLDLIGAKSGLNFYCAHFSYKDPTAKNFYNNYVNKFATEPTSFSALGYDAINLISSLKLANFETETILAELNKVKDFNGVTGIIDFSKGTNPNKNAVIIRVKDGKLSIERKIIP